MKKVRRQLESIIRATGHLRAVSRGDWPNTASPGANPLSVSDATPALRLLLVEDHELDAELVLSELVADGLKIEVERVESEPAFVEALHTFAPDLILSDLSMPAFSGYRALELACTQAPDVPNAVVMEGQMNLMTGVVTASKLLEMEYQGPLILIAGKDRATIEHDLPPLRTIRFIDKPVDAEQLLVVIADELDAARADVIETQRVYSSINDGIPR